MRWLSCLRYFQPSKVVIPDLQDACLCHRETYENLLVVLKIRPLKIRAARGLTSQLRVPETDREITLAEAEKMAPLEQVSGTSIDQEDELPLG